MNRRDVLKALLAGSAVLQLPAAEPGAPLFFSPPEFALLETLTEIIIPTDAHSPGAKEAKVAAFIDRMAAESIRAEEKDEWRRGLALVNEAADKAVKKRFVEATREQQIHILTEFAGKEDNPSTPAEKFFAQVKTTTAFGYYSSSLGIHQEMEYKGNVLLNQFVGYDAA